MQDSQRPTQPSPLLPELPEQEAPQSVRSIYNALRQGAATPIAALIWRHIATHPDMLEACWAALEPLFADGRLQTAAWRIARDSTPRNLLPATDPRALRLLGMSGDDAASIEALVEAYNRANPVNMLGVKTLLARISLDGPGEAPQRPGSPWSPPAAIMQGIPPMMAPADMDPAIRELLADLRIDPADAGDTVVPSLYRHLTDWPAYIALLQITLRPHFQNGAIAASVEKLVRAMDGEADRLARQMAPVDALKDLPALQATMRRFSGGVIPTMIIVGRAMADQLSRK